VLLQDAGITVHCLNMPRGFVTLNGIWMLMRLLRRMKPDVVQTWMYHADLVGGLAAYVVGIRRILWGSHHANLDSGKVRLATRIVARFNALLSHWIPWRIVSCSHRGASVHQAIGYAADKFVVIPNGYNLDQFASNSQARTSLRSNLSIPEGMVVLGMVARFDPQKDHLNLIRALGLLKQSGLDFRCMLIGDGMNESNAELVDWLDAHGIRERMLLLGQRRDIVAIMNALDVHVLSSLGEAFPNVLCEAMACGTPCITTDVGDAKLIVGDTGWVVPAKSSEMLAEAISNAVNTWFSEPELWKRRQIEARQRVFENFSIEKMVERYSAIWARSGFGSIR